MKALQPAASCCVGKVTDGSVSDLLAEATQWILHVMALFEQIVLHHVF